MWRLLGLVIALCVQLSTQQSCTTQQNTAYNNAGDLVTLFNVASSGACCEACAGFEECNYYSYVRDTKQCTVKTNSTAGSGSPSTTTDSGYNTRIYKRPTACSQDESGYDYFLQNNVGSFQAATPTDCCNGCAAKRECQYWSLDGNMCWMKTNMGNRTPKTGVVSGTVIPQALSNVPKRTGTKRGIALYETKSCSDIRLLGNVTWVYNWSEDPGTLEECFLELGIQFVPMIWGLNSHPEYVYGKSPYLLTFNEPNFPDQSNMSPQQAVNFWPQIEAVAAKYNMKISSPSASYGGANMDPIAWLDSFFSLCPTCKVDFITTHQYECNAASMHGAIGNFRKYNKPIWVTEFACYGQKESDELSFAQQILTAFDGDSDIERYAWFGTRTTTAFNNIFDNSKNGLSNLGVLYAGGPPAGSNEPDSGASALGVAWGLIYCVTLAVYMFA